MEFRVLGPLEVRGSTGELLMVTRRKQRVLLAMLLLRANRTVRTDSIIDGLWQGQQPASAAANVQCYVSNIRTALGRGGHTDRLVTARGGYRVRAAADEIDALRFEDLATEGLDALRRRAFTLAAERLTKALSLWRSGVLEGLALPDAWQPELVRLEERRLSVLEGSIEARLALGHYTQLAAELFALVREHPLRERLWQQLMLALYRSGRQAEALAAYQEVRRQLDDELGIAPGPTLTRLHRQILRADPRLNAAVEVNFVRPNTPRQLPACPTVFVGRATALRSLDALLEHPVGPGHELAAPTIATITGPPGIGKTALAVQWAHRVVRHFPDGQLYSDLHGYSSSSPLPPLTILGGFLRCLGIRPDAVPERIDEAASLYRSMLAERRVLVVLDNARSAGQVRQLLPGSPTCLALVTSRNRLGGLAVHEGVQRVPLGQLSSGEAYELLAEMLGPARVEAEPEAARRLVEWCGRLPLGLRITGVNLTNSPGRFIVDHLALAPDGESLSALQLDDSEGISVRAEYDQSYRALPPLARQLFRYLGLLPPGPITVPAAAALLALRPLRITQLCGLLVDAHMLEQCAEGRYRLADLTRQYALLLTKAEDSDASRTEALRRVAPGRDYPKVQTSAW